MKTQKRPPAKVSKAPKAPKAPNAGVKVKTNIRAGSYRIGPS
jgi:hypothetical protein